MRPASSRKPTRLGGGSGVRCRKPARSRCRACRARADHIAMKPVLQVLLLVSALLPASVATRAQPQRDAEEIGLSGYVLAPDGTPVSSGSVLIQSPAARAS